MKRRVAEGRERERAVAEVCFSVSQLQVKSVQTVIIIIMVFCSLVAMVAVKEYLPLYPSDHWQLV